MLNVSQNSRRVSRLFACILALSLILTTIIPLLSVAAAPRRVTSPTLGGAAGFAILGGTLVSDVPTSAITGDVGLDPATGANITGLTCDEVTGNIYDNDAAYTGNGGSAGIACLITDAGALTTAKNDLITAYDGLAALDNATCTTDYGVGPQDLALVSPLGPGVYCAGSFTLSTNLALTGAGVWIFRSASTIITSPSSSVTSDDACNVWWRAETSAVLDTSTSFAGNILALTSITLNSGATLAGRALARDGAVTLDTNTISLPVCAPATSTPTNTNPPPPDDTRTPTAPPPATALPTLEVTATFAATAPPVVGLPAAGGNSSSPAKLSWPALLAVTTAGVIALGLGVRARRRARQAKQ